MGKTRQTKWDGTEVNLLMKRKMNCKQANDISIADFLFAQGIEPTRIHGNNYWYLSPIRNERTPSFKVDTSINRWYDYGIGVGGKLVDLGIRLFETSVPDFLEGLEGQTFSKPFFLHQPLQTKQPVIKKIKNLENGALIKYLEERAIYPLSKAKDFCVEIYYTINGKNYFAIGFKNDLGGYEIRNQYFKGTLGPKGITTIIGNEGSKFVLFEGFFDFLSAHSGNESITNLSVIILNSVNQINHAIEELKRHAPNEIIAYFDNDEAGKKCFATLKNSFPKAWDYSYQYASFNDLNEATISNKKLSK